MFTRHDRSPTPLRVNYDFTLRHERTKLFLKMISQCDGHVARTSQAVRDVISTFSQVSQSYYEVALCINNVNPSAASILQAHRGSVSAARGEAAGEVEPTDGLARRNFMQRKNVTVTRKGTENEIGYHDGVVARYGAGLQNAAKLFATETRGLKEGARFAEYSEGVHKGVLARLGEIQTAAKSAVDGGDETEKALKRLQKAKRVVALKEKKYERKGKPLTASKKYTKQVAAMHTAEEVYTAKLAAFDERYEHLFQRDLYVMGHTLDSFLDVNFTVLAHLMQVLGCVAPSAPETMDKVVLDGGDALGKRMGIAEEARLGSKVRRRRGSGRAAAAISSHNFTNYFSTRRDEPPPPPADRTHGGSGVTECDSHIADLDEAPPLTARNNDETSHDVPVRAPTTAGGGGSSSCGLVRSANPDDELARAFVPCGDNSLSGNVAEDGKTKQCDDEPEPRCPQPPACVPATAAVAPVHAGSNAPFGDTPSALHNIRQQQPGRSPGAARVVITKRNPSLSPSCEPFGYDTLREEVRAASAAYLPNSGVVARRDADCRENGPHSNHSGSDVGVSRCVFPSFREEDDGLAPAAAAAAAATAASAAPTPNRKPAAAVKPRPSTTTGAGTNRPGTPRTTTNTYNGVSPAQDKRKPKAAASTAAAAGSPKPTTTGTPRGNQPQPPRPTAAAAALTTPVLATPRTPTAVATAAPSPAPAHYQHQHHHQQKQEQAMTGTPAVSAPPPDSDSEDEEDRHVPPAAAAAAATAVPARTGAAQKPKSMLTISNVTKNANKNGRPPVLGAARRNNGSGLAGLQDSSSNSSNGQSHPLPGRPPASPSLSGSGGGGTGRGFCSISPAATRANSFSMTGSDAGPLARLTVAAVPGAFDGGAHAEHGFVPLQTNGGNTTTNNNSLSGFSGQGEEGRCGCFPADPSSRAALSVSDGATPRAQDLSGQSTPVPFFSRAWEEVNLAKAETN